MAIWINGKKTPVAPALTQDDKLPVAQNLNNGLITGDFRKKVLTPQVEGSQLVFPINDPDKNPIWYNQTPNELYETNSFYQELVNQWCRINDLRVKPYRWIEIRVISERTTRPIDVNSRWWANSLFMEKVFWVFNRPIKIFNGEKKDDFMMFYALETFECEAVAEKYKQTFMKTPFREAYPSLLLPVECCEQCFWDMEGGYSRHIRPRVDIAQTQAEKDEEGRKQKEIKEHLKNICPFEVTEDGKWKAV